MKLSEKQRQAKARFWQSVSGNPLVDPLTMSKQQLAKFAGNQQVVDWLDDAEFHDWFFNVGFNRQLLEAGAEEAVKALLAVVAKADARDSDKINAATRLLEYAGYTPAKAHKHKVETSVDEMTEEQLRTFIVSKAKQVGLLPSGDN